MIREVVRAAKKSYTEYVSFMLSLTQEERDLLAQYGIVYEENPQIISDELALQLESLDWTL